MADYGIEVFDKQGVLVFDNRSLGSLIFDFVELNSTVTKNYSPPSGSILTHMATSAKVSRSGNSFTMEPGVYLGMNGIDASNYKGSVMVIIW